MVKIDKYEFPEELYYNDKYLWARVEGNAVIVGLASFAAIESGEVSYLDLIMREDDEVEAGKPFGSIESGKGATTLYAPVSGTITEVNEDTEADPSGINNDCYGAGWIVKIEASNLDADVGKLMKPDSSAFNDWLQSEIKAAEEKRKELEG
ncbi:MAG: glycine cleavage system protein H [Candidatus Helarchaeota archaeon]|nr:glycine cleavage system protein H [Candidatus Helarchaeota archaeon]